MGANNIEDFVYNAESTEDCTHQEAWFPEAMMYVWSADSVSSSGEEVSVSAARSATSAIVPGECYSCARKKAFTRDTQSFEILLGRHRRVL
jgi:hypothetical protein